MHSVCQQYMYMHTILCVDCVSHSNCAPYSTALGVTKRQVYNFMITVSRLHVFKLYFDDSYGFYVWFWYFIFIYLMILSYIWIMSVIRIKIWSHSDVWTEFGGAFFSFDLSIDHNLFLITKKHTKDETNQEQKNIAFITNVNVVLCISSRNYNIKRVFNFKT